MNTKNNHKGMLETMIKGYYKTGRIKIRPKDASPTSSIELGHRYCRTIESLVLHFC